VFGEALQRQFNWLGAATQVVHAQHHVVTLLAHEGQHRGIVGVHNFERADTEQRVLFAHRDHAPHPVQQ
jgi:hypothetical protein